MRGEIIMGYTIVDSVRRLLPDILISEEDLGINASGKVLTLVNSAVGVPNILKDGTTLADITDYTFTQPRRITLSVAASGENFIATTYITFSDADITTLIEESDRAIDNKFVNLTAPSSAYKGDWSRYKTGSKILRITAKGDEDRLAWADSFDKIADDGITAYLEHTIAGVFDDSGVTRCDATSVSAFKLDQQDTERYAST